MFGYFDFPNHARVWVHVWDVGEPVCGYGYGFGGNLCTCTVMSTGRCVGSAYGFGDKEDYKKVENRGWKAHAIGCCFHVLICLCFCTLSADS